MSSPFRLVNGSDEEKHDHPTQKPVDLMRRPLLNHLKARRGQSKPLHYAWWKLSPSSAHGCAPEPMLWRNQSARGSCAFWSMKSWWARTASRSAIRFRCRLLLPTPMTALGQRINRQSPTPAHVIFCTDTVNTPADNVSNVTSRRRVHLVSISGNGVSQRGHPGRSIRKTPGPSRDPEKYPYFISQAC
jgi:hypothetical protein